jgi:hypothetical protein
MERKGRSHNGLAFIALNNFSTIPEEPEINHRLHRYISQTTSNPVAIESTENFDMQVRVTAHGCRDRRL